MGTDTTYNRQGRHTGHLRTKIAAGYILILLLVGGIVHLWVSEWRKLETFETENRRINARRMEVHEVYVRAVELSLLGETVLEWEEADVEEYRGKRQVVDSLLCRFNDIYPAERIDSVRRLLEDKENQLCGIMRVLDEQEAINGRIAERVPVIAWKSAQEEPKKAKRKGLFGIFGKREKPEPTATTTMLYTLNRDMIARQKAQSRRLSEHADSLAARNAELNRQLQTLIRQMDGKVQADLLKRETEITAMRERSFMQIGGLTGFVVLLLLFSYIIIHRNIKRRERIRSKLEESLRQNNDLLEMRKNIILTISHDIRGPLNVIGGSVELAMDAREKKKRDHHLKNVELLCKHILHLLNNLLDVYRLNDSKETINAVPFRLSDFLDRIAAGAAHIVNNKGLLFVPDFKGTDVTVMGDMDRMEQIIDNLLSNAVKFTDAGSVGFSAAYGDGRLVMAVSDTGVGMTEDALGRIFRPFQRIMDNTNADGFGLGLSITKGLVTLLDGTIEVASDVGKGTTFRVSLPLPETAEAVEEDTAGKETPLNLPHHVLVVDDDPLQLEVIREMLERNGVPCTACTTTAEVVGEIRKRDYDLLLTDIQMPGTSGFALLELLRKSNIRNSRTIPVIAMTARGDDEKDSLLGSGFTGCIFKPFSSAELLKCLSPLTDASPAYGRPDFTALLSEVSDKCGVLEKLAESSRLDIKELREAMEKDDRGQLRETVHRMWPLWELLRKEPRLGTYKEVLKDKDATREVIRKHTESLIDEIENLIIQSGNEIKTIRNEGQDTDSGR